MCGEKGLSTFWSRNHSGSPPRVRGKAYLAQRRGPDRGITPACAGKSAQLLHRAGCGITPACAGKSLLQVFDLNQCQDHPRVCGEKSERNRKVVELKGSPPRVRGKAQGLRSWPAGNRITPACAGKSPLLFGSIRQPQDHPRVCGEKSRRMERGPPAKGSPPRVRGKALRFGHKLHRTGITPACAGKRHLRQMWLV